MHNIQANKDHMGRGYGRGYDNGPDVIPHRHPCTGCVIARSSQPLVGVLSWRSSEDEKMLNGLSRACWDSRPASAMTPYPTELWQQSIR